MVFTMQTTTTARQERLMCGTRKTFFKCHYTLSFSFMLNNQFIE